MANEKRLIELGEALRMVQNSKDDCPETSIKGRAIWETAHNCALSCLTSCPTVEAVEVVRCAYCDPSSQDYNPCWLCKKGGTAHDVEHCHETNYGDYEPMQPNCHLCGRKL